MWQTLNTYKIWLWLVLAWFGCGVVGSLAGFFGFFYAPLAAVLVAPISILAVALFKCYFKFLSASAQEKLVIILIGLWWLLHSLQVFVPETGFDALWYHLPLAQQTITSHHFIGNLNFYQSFNPQFSDSIFYLGFAVAGELGAKIIAYLFGLTLALTTYLLSRQLLNRTFSLLIVLLVSSFQVVSWQSSSFYVDIPKAVWELAALVLLFKKSKDTQSAGLFFGASLATKLFSLLLLPLMATLSWIHKGKKASLLFVLISVLVATPYYLFAHSISGNAFYSAAEHINKLPEISQSTSLSNLVIQKILMFPIALWQLVANRDYTTPLVIMFIPLVFVMSKDLSKNKIALSLALFSAYQLLLWWFIPPTSVRYALSGFITATVFVVYALTVLIQQKQNLFYGLLIAGILAMPVRIMVAFRSWPYLLGQQSKQEYLQQFLDGNIDTVLKKWHNSN